MTCDINFVIYRKSFSLPTYKSLIWLVIASSCPSQTSRVTIHHESFHRPCCGWTSVTTPFRLVLEWSKRCPPFFTHWLKRRLHQHPPTFINSESLPILRYLHLLNNPFLEAQPYMKKSLSMAIPSATLWKVFEGEDGLLSPRSSSNREKERTRERERGICSPERTRRGFSVAPLSPGMRKRHGTLSPLHDRFSASSYQGTMPNENEGSGAIDQSFDPNVRIQCFP